MLMTASPACDVDPTHVGTIGCVECDEFFCAACDAFVHARKKYRAHVRETIEIVSEEEYRLAQPQPCDACNQQEANMHCEACEENYCTECDYKLHNRPKTADHPRYEGARHPEVAEALRQQARAEEAALNAKMAGASVGAKGATTTAAASTKDNQQTAASSKSASSSSTVAASATTSAASSSSYAAAAATGAKNVAAANAAVAAKATVKPSMSVQDTASSPAVAAPTATSGTPNEASGAKPKKKTTPSPATPSSDTRVAEHTKAWNDMRTAQCKKTYGVGHWLGLTTEQRKMLATTLCKELLFNPVPVDTPESTVTVEWNVTTYWTTYEVDVSCVKTELARTKKGATKQTVIEYRVHIDDAGRLDAFDVVTDGNAVSGCTVM